MNAEMMRYALLTKTIYSHSLKWQTKVHEMSDKQVVAVYLRLLNSSKKYFIR